MSATMTRHERRQLTNALKSARALRTTTYNARLAHAGSDALAAKLDRVHAEACAIEAEIHKVLLRPAEGE